MVARAVEVQLDVFNVLNLLNGNWGRLRAAAPARIGNCEQGVMEGEVAACCHHSRVPRSDGDLIINRQFVLNPFNQLR